MVETFTPVSKSTFEEYRKKSSDGSPPMLAKTRFDLSLIAYNAVSGHEDRSDDASSKMQEMRRSHIVD